MQKIYYNENGWVCDRYPYNLAKTDETPFITVDDDKYQETLVAPKYYAWKVVNGELVLERYEGNGDEFIEDELEINEGQFACGSYNDPNKDGLVAMVGNGYKETIEEALANISLGTIVELLTHTYYPMTETTLIEGDTNMSMWNFVLETVYPATYKELYFKDDVGEEYNFYEVFNFSIGNGYQDIRWINRQRENAYDTGLYFKEATSNYIRQNALEVYDDGHAEVQAQGETPNSVATRQFVLDNYDGGSGGTKLYRHQVSTSVNNVSNWSFDIILITASPEPLTGATMYDEIVNAVAVRGTAKYEGFQLRGTILGASSHQLMWYDDGPKVFVAWAMNFTQSDVDGYVSLTTDIVEEL